VAGSSSISVTDNSMSNESRDDYFDIFRKVRTRYQNIAISRSEQRGMEQPRRNVGPPQLAASAVM